MLNHAASGRCNGAQRVDVAARPADQLKRTSEIINDELMSCCI
jgi:hypothetical protein